MIRLLVLPLFFCVGCASVLQKILPASFQPVTVERCRGLEMKKMGYQDGEIGQRPGDRFEYWMKDCRQIGVPLDRGLYDEGFAEGMKSYCSCEKGFNSGVKDEYTELRGEYFACNRVEYQNFLRGHEGGLKFSKEPSFMEKAAPHRMKYFEDKIHEKAVVECKVILATPLPAHIKSQPYEAFGGKGAVYKEVKKEAVPAPTPTPTPAP